MDREGRIAEGERLLQRASRAGGASGPGAAVAEPPAAPSRPLAPGNGLPQAAATAPAARQGRRRRIIVPLLAIVLFIASIAGYRYWRDQTLYVSTDNASVSGALIQVGSVNAGRLSAVNVDVGTSVAKDEPVASVVLPSALSLTSDGTPRLGFRGTADQQVTVASPIDGVVVQRLGNPGDTVAVGQAIVTIVDPTHLWVQAQVEETKINRVRVGQPVDVHVDTLGQVLPGRVSAVDRASAASFSLLPQGNASGNFTKVTQLVPVKVAVEYGRQPLVLGSSVEVKIHVQ